MPVTLVQQASAASSAVTLGANATAGNTLVVAVACLGSTSATGVTGITLGGNPDNFTLVTPGPSAQDTTSPNDFISVGVWVDANCAGGSTAISVTGTGVVAAWAFEFSGLSGLIDLFQVFPVTGYHDSWVTSLPQTTVPAEAWLAITCAANQTATETLTVNNVTGWTTETAYNGTSGSYFWGGVAAYQTVNTVGPLAWSGAFSQASFSVTVLVALPAGTPPAAVAKNAPLPTNVAVRGSLATTGGITAGGQITQGGAPVGLTPTSVKTGNYTAQPGDFVIVQTKVNQTMTVTFPSGVATGSMIGVKLINAANLLTVQASGTDVFDALPAGTTQLQLNTSGATFIAQYKASVATWYIQSASFAEPATTALFPAIGVLPAAPAVNSPLPGDLSFVTWSYDPASLTSPLTGTALASGKIYLVMCPVRATSLLSNAFSAWITSAGSGLTAGQNFVGVYSAAGTLLFNSGDVTTAFGTAGAFTLGIFGAPVAGPPFVWAVFLANGTTPPSFARTANQAGLMLGNAGLPGPRFGTLSGTFTSLPSSFSPSSISAAPTAYFVGLS